MRSSKCLVAILGFAALSMGPVAEARVFNFEEEPFASYLQGSLGFTERGQDAYKKATTDVGYGDTPSYIYSGEIGFSYTFAEAMGIRFGLQFLEGERMKAVAGKNAASGTKLFDLDSRIFVMNPVVTLEYLFSHTPQGRGYFYAGLGYATITVENHYTMTAPGTAAYAGQADYAEKSETTKISAHAGLGYERLFTDTVTMGIDIGYRYLPVSKLKHKNAIDSIPEDTAAAGGTVHNFNGHERTFDLSGFYAALAFRFYIDL